MKAGCFRNWRSLETESALRDHGTCAGFQYGAEEMTTTFTLEIREGSDPDGGLVLEALIEGNRVATARASVDALQDVHDVLGFDRAEVANQLRESLVSLVKGRLEDVTVSDIVELPGSPLRYSGRYTLREFEEITTGLVWYDVTTSTTGPESISSIVTNRMRREVLRLLTPDNGTARTLIDGDLSK